MIIGIVVIFSLFFDDDQKKEIKESATVNELKDDAIKLKDQFGKIIKDGKQVLSEALQSIDGPIGSPPIPSQQKEEPKEKTKEVPKEKLTIDEPIDEPKKDEEWKSL